MRGSENPVSVLGHQARTEPEQCMALMPRAQPGSGCTKEQKCKFPSFSSLPLRAAPKSPNQLILSSLPLFSPPPKPSSPFDVRTSLLNVPCCDKPLLSLFSVCLVHAEISLSSFQRKGEYRSKHGYSSARPSCIILPRAPGGSTDFSKQ